VLTHCVTTEWTISKSDLKWAQSLFIMLNDLTIQENRLSRKKWTVDVIFSKIFIFCTHNKCKKQINFSMFDLVPLSLNRYWVSNGKKTMMSLRRHQPQFVILYDCQDLSSKMTLNWSRRIENMAYIVMWSIGDYVYLCTYISMKGSGWWWVEFDKFVVKKCQHIFAEINA
jgi:hypothetical protein